VTATLQHFFVSQMDSTPEQALQYVHTIVDDIVEANARNAAEELLLKTIATEKAAKKAAKKAKKNGKGATTSGSDTADTIEGAEGVSVPVVDDDKAEAVNSDSDSDGGESDGDDDDHDGSEEE